MFNWLYLYLLLDECVRLERVPTRGVVYSFDSFVNWPPRLEWDEESEVEFQFSSKAVVGESCCSVRPSVRSALYYTPKVHQYALLLLLIGSSHNHFILQRTGGRKTVSDFFNISDNFYSILTWGEWPTNTRSRITFDFSCAWSSFFNCSSFSFTYYLLVVLRVWECECASVS